MTPPPATAARRAPAERRERPAPTRFERPDLRVVGDAPRRGRSRRGRLAPVLAASLVIGSLLLVVAGHAVLAEGQVRLSAVQSALSTAQAANGQDTLSLAALESPARIVAQAKDRLHMVEAGQIVELPYVPLGTPLPTPTVSPAPAAPASP
ncbi:MAG: hypothetical protein ACLP62_14630 [Acidimicrobiales bacterium]